MFLIRKIVLPIFINQGSWFNVKVPLVYVVFFLFAENETHPFTLTFIIWESVFSPEVE